MKKGIKMLSIVLMTMLLSFNASFLFSQNQGKTVKKWSVYIGSVKSPQQIAAYGTPAWLFSTMNVMFDGNQCAMSFITCAYSIDPYTGGLGRAVYSEDADALLAAYSVKNGNVYIWDPDEEEPKDDAGYYFIFTINDDGLTLIKTSVEGMKLGKFVYMSDYKKMEKMSEAQLQQVEVAALSKLLKNR